jgi:esterase/lipase superfamily enzyme
MELLRFGHAGEPLIVFPTSMGRFYDYEARDMLNAAAASYHSGTIQAFCVDSVDTESWYNKGIHPRDRVRRHAQYEDYIRLEVLPFIHNLTGVQHVFPTGCSFGGYHAANFALRHPELCSGFSSNGGAFDITQFVDGYYDDTVYFNCPPHFLPNLSDPAILHRMRHMKIILAAGEHDFCCPENERLSNILHQKSIPHVLDIWGDGAAHDWPWWHAMTAKFLG